MGSFFGEKCAFHSHYLSTVSYRAKVDLEVLTIDRNAFVDLLNTYDAFAETFVMICQKREDHKKGLVAGQSKKTDKVRKRLVGRRRAQGYRVLIVFFRFLSFSASKASGSPSPSCNPSTRHHLEGHLHRRTNRPRRRLQNRPHRSRS